MSKKDCEETYTIYFGMKVPSVRFQTIVDGHSLIQNIDIHGKPMILEMNREDDALFLQEIYNLWSSKS